MQPKHVSTTKITTNRILSSKILSIVKKKKNFCGLLTKETQYDYDSSAQTT